MGPTSSADPSAVGATDHIHQFRNLAALVGLVAGGDRVFDAVRDMIAQDLFLDPAQSCACRGDLRHNVDAIAVGCDHLAKSADLAFDSFQPFLAG